MTTFEYVSVILSVVVSLAFTHVLTGVVRLIHARDLKFSIVYTAWVVLLLFWCVDYWFSLWQLHTTAVWSLGFVAFLLLLAMVLYVTCGLAVPAELEATERIDMQAFHAANHRRYLGALFVYQVLSIFGNLATASLQGAALVNVGQLALIGIAWKWGGHRIQAVAVIAMYILTGWYAYRYIPAL